MSKQLEFVCSLVILIDLTHHKIQSGLTYNLLLTPPPPADIKSEYKTLEEEAESIVIVDVSTE